MTPLYHKKIYTVLSEFRGSLHPLQVSSVSATDFKWVCVQKAYNVSGRPKKKLRKAETIRQSRFMSVHYLLRKSAFYEMKKMGSSHSPFSMGGIA